MMNLACLASLASLASCAARTAVGSTLLRGAGRKRRTVDAARRCLDACRRAGRTAVSTGAGNRAGEEKIALARATTMPSVFALTVLP